MKIIIILPGLCIIIIGNCILPMKPTATIEYDCIDMVNVTWNKISPECLISHYKLTVTYNLVMFGSMRVNLLLIDNAMINK